MYTYHHLNQGGRSLPLDKSEIELQDVVQHLWIINKRAKFLEQENTQRGFKQSIGKNKDSEKVEKIYKLKHKVLNDYYTEASKFELHVINDTNYYCLFFNSHSFHIPQSELEGDIDIIKRQTLTNINSDGIIPSEDKFLEAIEFFDEQLDYNIPDILTGTQRSYSVEEIRPVCWDL